MKTRKVVTTIDSLVEIFRDYFPAGDIPVDAMASKLYFHPVEKKFMIEAISQDWVPGMPDLHVNFQIKRIHAV